MILHGDAPRDEAARDAATAGAPPWRLGTPEVDHQLGSSGLALDGLHEVKPALTGPGGVHAGEWAAALAFVLRLAGRRLAIAVQGERERAPPVLLWCQPRHVARELGRLHPAGLAHLGIAPERVVLVETGTRDETLWAMEEGLASGALALVAGILDDIALTPARRLALRAARSGTPCVVLTSPRAAPAAATATRWRIARAPGAPHPFDRRAPGALRLGVMLERCRQRPLLGEAETFTLEWSDAAYRFHLAAGLADRAHGARSADRHAA